MIRRFLIATLIALPFSVFAQKFGIVDAATILSAMPEYTQMQTTLENASKQYQEAYAKLEDEMNKKYTEYQNLEKDPNALATIKESRIQELQELQQKIQQFSSIASQDLQRQQQQLMAPIEQKLMDAIKAVGQEGAFTFIFPKEVPLYYGATAEDVTNLVKTKLGI